MREYVEDGRLAVVFIDFPIPSHGYPAVVSHEAAHCAGEQGRYWEMHDALFEQQDVMASVPVQEEAASQAAAIGIGVGIGLDEATLRECVESTKYRPAVAHLVQQGLDAGIDTTPTLILKGGEGQTEIVPGFLTYEELQPVVERALARAQGTEVPEADQETAEP